MDTVVTFNEFIGLEKVQRGICISLVSPKVGSLIIAGKRGTGKSALLHSLVEILPGMKKYVVPNYIQEEMLLGSIDLEQAMAKGKLVYKKGLLGNGNQHLLVMDNAQLAQRNILKNILNTQKTGFYKLERDGLSLEIKTDFNFIATYTFEDEVNIPLTKFSMYVETEELKAVEQRLTLLKTVFIPQHNESLSLKKIREDLLWARGNYYKVEISPALVSLVGKYCEAAKCLGNEVELYIVAVAKAIAALARRLYVLPRDIDEAVTFVLPHQISNGKNNSFNDEDRASQEGENQRENQDISEDVENSSERDKTEEIDSHKDLENYQHQGDEGSREDADEVGEEGANGNRDEDIRGEDFRDEEYVIDENLKLPSLNVLPLLTKGLQSVSAGKRRGVYIENKVGKYIKGRITKVKKPQLALLPTILAAAPHQYHREPKDLKIKILPQDYREKVFVKPMGNAFIFLVDSSSSMGVQKRMSMVKGAILEMLKDAYINRDKVAMIAFRGNGAEVLLNLTSSMELANRRLKEMPTGGKTPLAAGLAKAFEMIYRCQNKQRPILILLTDGKANSGKYQGRTPWEEAKYWGREIGKLQISSLVIDTNKDFLKLHLAEEIAQLMGAKYYSLQEITKLNLITLAQNLAR